MAPIGRPTMVASLRCTIALLAGVAVIANLRLQMMLAGQPSFGEGEVTLPGRHPDDWIMFSKDTAYFR